MGRGAISRDRQTDEDFIDNVFGRHRFRRCQGDALHPAQETADTLERLRKTIGEYNFAGQYQQTPSALGGGLVLKTRLNTSALRTVLDDYGTPEQWPLAKGIETRRTTRILPWGRNSQIPSSRFFRTTQFLIRSMALYFLHYNLMRVHKTLRVTPAMASGVADWL